MTVDEDAGGNAPVDASLLPAQEPTSRLKTIRGRTFTASKLALPLSVLPPTYLRQRYQLEQ